MRTRLAKSQRRADILATAKGLFAAHGFTETEMEDIRRACALSRGGLYHHFANKRAVLDAVVAEEVAQLSRLVSTSKGDPLSALLTAGSSHLGAHTGVLATLQTHAEKQDYLSALDQAITADLSPVLAQNLAASVKPGTDPAHVAELFLTINAHINRREILGDWSRATAAAFAATALTALAPLLKNPETLHPIIADLKAQST